MRKNWMTLLVEICLAVFMIGAGFACSAAPSPAKDLQLTPSNTPVILSPTPTDTPQPVAETATPTPTESPYTCGYAWATQPLPDVTAQVLKAMQAAGLSEIGGRAEAYGENCLDAQTGKPRSFATMETDFRLTLPVPSLADEQALGQAVEQILNVLDEFKVGQVPGPQPGYIGIAFTSGNDTLNLWFRRTDGDTARQKGLKGADLLTALKH